MFIIYGLKPKYKPLNNILPEIFHGNYRDIKINIYIYTEVKIIYLCLKNTPLSNLQMSWQKVAFLTRTDTFGLLGNLSRRFCDCKMVIILSVLRGFACSEMPFGAGVDKVFKRKQFVESPIKMAGRWTVPQLSILIINNCTWVNFNAIA